MIKTNQIVKKTILVCEACMHTRYGVFAILSYQMNVLDMLCQAALGLCRPASLKI